ncbi:DNA adenine methylase [Rubinisphaera sp. JC750]|uniref:DNA adenine methylase n=1 Tax=Rubinisphaera sp. JC750 TaxID=2898658 RepID=UPI001F235C5B|nr:DNA adenine methylase [Rubinisphaera sp. JC750]
MIANTTQKRTSAPIKWHGGKFYLASQIIERIPSHTHYVEPYFGGGAVLFRKPQELVEGHSEVINDIYGDLVNFWRVVQSPRLFEQFEFQVSLTPFAKPVWENACNLESDDSVERACAFFIRYRQSRQGLGRDFATMSRSRTRRGMNEQVASWLSAVEGLAAAHERLARVVILCDNAVNVIRQEDSPHTFFYLDPPYVANTRVVKNAYSFEMTNDDHDELLKTLGTIKGTFLLSGYQHPLYNEAAMRFGWNRHDTVIDNKASGQKVKPKKIECLWANF